MPVEEGRITLQKAVVITSGQLEESFKKLAQVVASFNEHAFTESRDQAAKWRSLLSEAPWLNSIKQILGSVDALLGHLESGHPVLFSFFPFSFVLFSHAQLTLACDRFHSPRPSFSTTMGTRQFHNS